MEKVRVVMTYPDGTTKVQEFDYNDETDLVVSQIRKSDIAIKQQRDFLHNLPVDFEEQKTMINDIIDAVAELGKLVTATKGV